VTEQAFSRYPPILDLPGVADLLGLSIEEARRLAGEGWLPSSAVGGSQRFRRDEVLAWLREQRVDPPEQPEADPVG